MVIVNAADTLLREIDNPATQPSSYRPNSTVVLEEAEEQQHGSAGEGSSQEVIEIIDSSFEPGIAANKARKEKERVEHQSRSREPKGTDPVYNSRDKFITAVLNRIGRGWNCKLNDFHWSLGKIHCKMCDKQIVHYRHIGPHIARDLQCNNRTKKI